LKNFRGISRELFPVTDSSEILEKFSRIGPQDERFLWDHSFETQFREFLRNTYPEISEKFLGLGHHVYGFLGEFIKSISFEKFLGISPEFQIKENPENFF